MDLSPILQFLTAYKDPIGLAFGSGTFLALGKFAWWFRQQQRKQLVSLDQFPFEVFKPNEVTIQRLMGEGRTDELADHNIPYLQRVAGRNIGRELRQGLDDRGWVLILGAERTWQNAGSRRDCRTNESARMDGFEAEVSRVVGGSQRVARR